jgi:hypothetical protein
VELAWEYLCGLASQRGVLVQSSTGPKVPRVLAKDLLGSEGVFERPPATSHRHTGAAREYTSGPAPLAIHRHTGAARAATSGRASPATRRHTGTARAPNSDAPPPPAPSNLLPQKRGRASLRAAARPTPAPVAGAETRPIPPSSQHLTVSEMLPEVLREQREMRASIARILEKL